MVDQTKPEIAEVHLKNKAKNYERKKITEKDWITIEEELYDQAKNMDISELYEMYVEDRKKEIKENDRIEYFEMGWLPCISCNNFKDECDCN